MHYIWIKKYVIAAYVKIHSISLLLSFLSYLSGTRGRILISADKIGVVLTGGATATDLDWKRNEKNISFYVFLLQPLKIIKIRREFKVLLINTFKCARTVKIDVHCIDSAFLSEKMHYMMTDINYFTKVSKKKRFCSWR